MINRYSGEEMAELWTDSHKYHTWLQVERAVLLARKKLGQITQKEYEDCYGMHPMTTWMALIPIEEQKTKHDVVAFLNVWLRDRPKAEKWVHRGMTSSDLVDTANALIIKEATSIVAKKTNELRVLLHNTAGDLAYVYAIGRTHGQHAEPVTIGTRLLSWYENLCISDFTPVPGKLSGPVGLYNEWVTPELERQTMKILELPDADRINTQVVAREHYARLLCDLALLAATLEKIALQFRLLQQEEIGEMFEGFADGQAGSSSMPYKKNPITSENICGLSRVVRSNAMAMLESVALWNERDISHSSVERIILPDSFGLVDHMLDKTTDLIKNMKIGMECREKVHGPKIAGQKLMFHLVDCGLPKEEAYAVVQEQMHFLDPFAIEKCIYSHPKITKLIESGKTTQEKIDEVLKFDGGDLRARVRDLFFRFGITKGGQDDQGL